MKFLLFFYLLSDLLLPPALPPFQFFVGSAHLGFYILSTRLLLQVVLGSELRAQRRTEQNRTIRYNNYPH